MTIEQDSESSWRHQLPRVAAVVALVVVIGVFMHHNSPYTGPIQAPDPSGSVENLKQQGFNVIGENELFWQNIQLDGLHFDLSSYHCTDEERMRQTCMFTDIVLHLGQLYYIIEDGVSPKKVRLPDPVLFEVHNSPSRSYSVDGLLKRVSERQMLDIIRNEIDKYEPRKSPQFLEFQHSMFARTRTFTNWFWMVNGAGNWYHRFCKYFGVCTLQEMRATAILHPKLNSTDLTDVGYVGPLPNFYTAVHDLLRCFGTIFWVNHGDVPVGTEVRFEERIVLLKQMMVGVGPDVVHPRTTREADGRVHFDQASNELAQKRIHYMRQCAGLDAIPSQPKRPRILLLNRPYTDGRSILGLDDVYDRLQRQLDQNIKVDILLPRGTMSLNMQAKAFDSHDIVVLPHGAANGNVNFLPHNAVVIMVFALSGRYQHERTLVQSMPNPPYNLDILPIDCSNRSEGWISGALAIPDFTKKLKPQEQLDLLNADMSNKRKEDWEKKIDMSRLDWMSYKAYRPDPEEVVNRILEAIKMWEKKSAS